MSKKKEEVKREEGQVTISEMRGYAKELDIKVRGKKADELKEEILDAIEEAVEKAKAEKQGKKYARKHRT